MAFLQHDGIDGDAGFFKMTGQNGEELPRRNQGARRQVDQLRDTQTSTSAKANTSAE